MSEYGKDFERNIQKYGNFLILPAESYIMLGKGNRRKIQKALFILFSCDITEEDAKQIIDILQYKKLYPLKTPKKEKRLSAFLEEFWNWEKSPYIKERLVHKHGIHKMYVKRSLSAVRNYWITWFGKTKLLSTITRKEVQDFVMSFMERTSPATAQAKNDIIRSGTIALKWAFNNGLIDKDITSGLSYYSGDSPQITILAPEIVKKLFSRPWEHKKAMLANKLALLTGMRSGEIQALRKCDIGQDCIYVRHSWNSLDGLKPPKNGTERTIYVPYRDFLEELRNLVEPEDGFVFHIRSVYYPMDAKCWLRNLRSELKKLEVDKEIIEKIHFHSWRHYFTAHMKNIGNLEQHLLQRMTGHKTKIQKAVQQVFDSMITV